ncbi:hypothetical protein BCR34DRAFT_202190 [Clohesyomyces aquaticus]|uniref:RBR-type E3 ubiquitin transferase n=1 Tax=Clohesyomyces aquaticus TaxID=1231657 RepID=A0A1Y1ZYR8_9PLEO|nr:hypothetical protein BCR34DRAFT_202190 [Clohesyomyces aquaticus]
MGSKISKAARRPPADQTATSSLHRVLQGTARPHEGLCQEPNTSKEMEPAVAGTSLSLPEHPTVPATATPEHDVATMDTDTRSEISRVSYQADIHNAAVLLDILRRQAEESAPSGPFAETQVVQLPSIADAPSGPAQQEANMSTELMLAPPPPPPPPPPMGGAPAPAPFVSLPPPPPPAELKIVCIICCEQFSRDQEYSAVIRPCKSCSSPYCTACVKDMFIQSCKDLSRMPPRCCNMIQLHVALPYLTDAEAATFRERYEEWSTPNPAYCPVPTCSAFLSPRLLSQPTSRKGKQRVDSVIGTPKSAHVACPKCRTDVCTHCLQLAHEGNECKKLEFGMVDDETVALLMSWGYKRCPKCGNGVRRMWGCNHIQCRCGGQWCWVCQNAWDECGGNCYEDEDEDLDEDEEWEENLEPVNTELDLPPPAVDGTAPAEAVVVLTEEGSAAPDTTAPVAEPSTAATQTTEAPPATQTQPSQTPRRPRNLDSRPALVWQELDLDFGDEPSEDAPDRIWACSHKFETAKVSFADSVHRGSSAIRMECSKCWSHVHAEMKVPLTTKPAETRIVAGMTRGAAARRGGGLNHGRGRLVRGDAMVGLGAEASASSASLPLPLTQSFPVTSTSTQSELMEDVKYTSPTILPIMDIYGNRIQTSASEVQPRRRRASFSFSTSTPPSFGLFPQLDGPSDLDILNPESPFSFAYECRWCSILVCETCKEELLPKPKEPEPEPEPVSESGPETATTSPLEPEAAAEVVPEPSTSTELYVGAAYQSPSIDEVLDSTSTYTHVGDQIEGLRPGQAVVNDVYAWQ